MQKTINLPTGKISYTISGNGKPVMLVHGFGEDASIWKTVLPALKDYLVIVPDVPGTGNSDLLKGENIGVENYAECLAAILEAESIPQCAMIGHSMGGYITLAFAEKFAEKLYAFGLYHSSAMPDSEEKKEARQKGIEFIKNHGAVAFVKSTLPNLFADISIHKEEANALAEKAKLFTNEALIQYYHAMMARPDRTSVLKQSNVPVLFILGEHDKAVPFEQGLKQTHMPKQAHVHILRHSGHLGMLEERQKANEILRLFLDSI